jgi:hypothetical protein
MEGRVLQKSPNVPRYVALEFLQYLDEDEIRKGPKK